MKFRIEIARNRVKKQLRRVPKSDIQRIKKAIALLAQDPVPSGAISLAQNIYRIRVGDYRVIYKVLYDERIILIGKVARRSEKTYKDFKELFG